jgi:hypothetical protein
MALRTVNPWLDHRHDARHVAALTRATRYSLLPTIDSESPARGGREPGSEEASSRREQRSENKTFLETPSPSNRSSRGMIFHRAGSRSMRVQTE